MENRTVGRDKAYGKGFMEHLLYREKLWREKERRRKYNEGKERVPEVEWQVLPRSRP